MGKSARSALLKLRSYNAWRALKERCNNPKHQFAYLYGAAGIKVCEKWATYAGFFEDMGEPAKGAQIDRIDSNGDYCKENCRWATASQNMANRRPWNSLGLKGVFQRPSGRFGACITSHGKSKVIGTYDTALEAAKAYDEVAMSLYGEYALTNLKMGKIV